MISPAALDMLFILMVGLCIALMYFVWKVSSELKYHEELLKDYIEAINNHAEHLENAKDVLNDHAKHIDNINSFLKDLGDCLDEEEDTEGGDDQNG